MQPQPLVVLESHPDVEDPEVTVLRCDFLPQKGPFNTSMGECVCVSCMCGCVCVHECAYECVLCMCTCVLGGVGGGRCWLEAKLILSKLVKSKIHNDLPETLIEVCIMFIPLHVVECKCVTMVTHFLKITVETCSHYPSLLLFLLGCYCRELPG